MQVGGWPAEVISVTDQPFNEHTIVPKAVTIEGIERVKQAWEAAVSRALAAGVDVSSPDLTALWQCRFRYISRVCADIATTDD